MKEKDRLERVENICYVPKKYAQPNALTHCEKQGKLVISPSPGVRECLSESVGVGFVCVCLCI